MGKRLRKLRCPTCKQSVLRTDAEFPFCSERCRLIDLGKWASGAYVVSTSVFDPDAEGEGMPLQASDDGGQRPKS
ncbi:MAG: DNA gyrase inhibitor YacG [Terriglobales bacterium]